MKTLNLKEMEVIEGGLEINIYWQHVEQLLPLWSTQL